MYWCARGFSLLAGEGASVDCGRRYARFWCFIWSIWASTCRQGSVRGLGFRVEDSGSRV